MATKLDEIKKRLWSIANDLRANSGLKTSEYAEPMLGLIFLRFANERFKTVTAEIQAAKPAGYEITNDDYLERNALILPQRAQFDELLKLPENSNMSEIINEAMTAIEELNDNLKGTLPKSFNRLSTSNIFALLKALASISFDIEGDVFGKIYEYFLSEFAMAEGQRGGQIFTPTSIVQLIVEIIEPFQGRIFDPACGSGGMFVQSARFVRNHQRNPKDDISIWGQEIVEETARLCRMNLAINELSGTIKTDNSLYGELHDLWGQFDFVMANPPFNVSGVDKTRLVDDTKRYPFGIPHTDNANYLWIQMFYSALNNHGRAGFAMANSAGDAGGSELDIRRQLLQKKAVDVIISIGPKFFYTVTLPCTLWFFDKDKVNTPREDTVLFIDARNIYRQIDRVHHEFHPEDIEFITNIVRLYEGKGIENSHGSLPKIQETFPNEEYADVNNLCRIATLEEIEAQGWSLNPGRYTGLLIPPKGFKQFKLRDIAKIQRGITSRSTDSTSKPLEKDTVNASEAYLLKARNIQDNGSIDIEALETVDSNGASITLPKSIDKRYSLQPDDIVVASLGNTRSIPVGIIDHDLPKNIVFTQSLVRIRVDIRLADPQSVFTFLRSETGQLMMRSYAPSLTGNFPQISSSVLDSISVFLPDSPRTKEVKIEELSSLSQVAYQLKNDILPLLEPLKKQTAANNDVQQLEAVVAEKLKNLASILSPLSLADKVMNNYPMPIALAYRRFLESQFNIYEHVLRLKDLFEATCFFIYNVVLADANQRLDPIQYKIKNNGARKAYNYYSMSDRMDFVAEIINIAKLNNGKDLFLPELIQSSIATLAKELQNDLRNALSHTATASASRQNSILQKYQPVVEDMLAQLEFLSNYYFIRLPFCYIKKGKLIYRIETYSGVTPKIEEKEMDDNLELILAEHDHIILMDSDNQILDLHPLYQLLANEATHHETHLCFFKQRKEGDKQLQGESVQGAFSILLDGFDDFKTL